MVNNKVRLVIIQTNTEMLDLQEELMKELGYEVDALDYNEVLCGKIQIRQWLNTHQSDIIWCSLDDPLEKQLLEYLDIKQLKEAQGRRFILTSTYPAEVIADICRQKGVRFEFSGYTFDIDNIVKEINKPLIRKEREAA